MPRNHNAIFHWKKNPNTLQLRQQAGLKSKRWIESIGAHEAFAWPHVPVWRPPLTFHLHQIQEKTIPTPGLHPISTAGPTEPQNCMHGSAHLLCLVTQESYIHISQHQVQVQAGRQKNRSRPKKSVLLEDHRMTQIRAGETNVAAKTMFAVGS